MNPLDPDAWKRGYEEGDEGEFAEMLRKVKVSATCVRHYYNAVAGREPDDELPDSSALALTMMFLRNMYSA